MDSFIDTDAYTVMNCAHRNRVIFSFKGTPSVEINSSIIQYVEEMLHASGDPRPVQKKVMNILTEGLQNMYHHLHPATHRPAWEASTILIIGRTEEGYFIKTGNYVDRDSEFNIDQRLRELEKLSENELRERHVAALKDGLRTKKGAGLGLIDIARRSNNKIRHKITQVTDQLSFFSLHVEIKF
ncbi:MAG: SiaB family protein kinase [Flavobacteriales bacterium]|nr:SiaB family protein kinase [Flavobacteriales bacterium]